MESIIIFATGAEFPHVPMEGRTRTRHPNRIRQIRKEKSMTQRKLASIMRYESTSSLSHLECGRKLPSLVTAMKLEAALQRPIRDISPRLFNAVYDPIGRRRSRFFRDRATEPRS